MKRNVLITGTSSGLGLETAILFARNGDKVFATMRDLSKKSPLLTRIKTENLDIAILELDVTNEPSVVDCIDKVISSVGHIDILVNNAGGGFAKTTEQATEEEIKWVTDLNYFGVVM